MKKNEHYVTVTLTFYPRSQISMGPSLCGKQSFSENCVKLVHFLAENLFTEKHTDTQADRQTEVKNISPARFRGGVKNATEVKGRFEWRFDKKFIFSKRFID